MKKFVAASLIGALVLSLTACSNITEADLDEILSDAASEIVSEVESEVASEVASGDEEVVDYPDFTGTFTEPMSGRCTIEIEYVEGDTHKVVINWSSSAAESANWEITAVYNPETDALEYTDAKYFIRTYTDEENYTDDVKYEDGAGKFWFEEDGTLGWKSENSDIDGIDGTTFFERIPVNVED